LAGTVTRRARGRAGYTLVEVLLSMAMAAVILAGLENLLLPLTKAQVLAMRGQTAQLSLISAQSAVERALRQATYVRVPNAPGLPADHLEGCENALVQPGQDPAPIDVRKPMRWFAFCTQDGLMYDHAGDGCPPAYACGISPLGSFGGGSLTPGATAQFTRSSAFTTVVDVSLAFASGEASSSAQSAFSFNGAAGTNQ
jgi:prepilin-type N-terminal cleavage/methylation domain-containing protein